MKLVSFSVTNYRSIINAHKLKLGELTVLVGPNNEGKSNVIKALVTAMRILAEQDRRFGRLLYPRLHRGSVDPPLASGSGKTAPISYVTTSLGKKLTAPHVFIDKYIYEWQNDFPISLQDKKADGQTIFTLEFALDKSEIADFKRDIESDLNGTLPLQISIGQDQKASIKVMKRGRGGAALSSKSAVIASFVKNRLEFEYIPAVRTARSAEDVVESLVERELATVEASPAYKEAIEKIGELQKPILTKLSQSIKPTMQRFLPAIKDIEFEITEEARVRALRRSTRMVVDDGSPTYLRYKGDGVQSLAALALMRHASEQSATDKNFVIAVEEPESHLHPKAIHSLRAVLQDLAAKHQVVITTHCPLFVQRGNIGANIIVNNNKAKAAKAIQEIRDLLGVRAADNLRHAELVLLVEGESDRICITALLQHLSKNLRAAFQEGTIATDSLAGGSNLAYKVGLVRDALCDCHCFVDHDSTGIKAVENAKLQALLADRDVNFATVQGMPESEIEDLFDVELYEQMILNNYRVSLNDPKFKGTKKWSERVRQCFANQGQTWNDSIEKKLKAEISALVKACPQDAMNEHRKGPLVALAGTLETRLKEFSIRR